jgi:hypothetical protein
MHTKLFLLILGLVLICATTASVNVFGQESIPNWVKNNARWWADGQITDDQYISAIQYLVSQGMVKVSNVQTQPSNPPTTPIETEKLVTNVRTSPSVSTGYYGMGQVSCNSNETMTGGGYYSPEFREMLSVYRNGPSDNGKTWLVEMMYVGTHFYGTAPQFTTYAMCTKLVP